MQKEIDTASLQRESWEILGHHIVNQERMFVAVFWSSGQRVKIVDWKEVDHVWTQAQPSTTPWKEIQSI